MHSFSSSTNHFLNEIFAINQRLDNTSLDYIVNKRSKMKQSWSLLWILIAVVEGFLPSSQSSSNHLSALFSENSVTKKVKSKSDSFLDSYSQSECDDANMPPSLSILMRSISNLPSGSDIRGRFVKHARLGSIANVALAISKAEQGIPPLTPFAAHCLGYAFATLLREDFPPYEQLTIAIGRDPREHGPILADAFGRGAAGVPNVKVVYTGIATTPAMFSFCRSSLCDGAVMVTASHLPADRNGMKFFTLKGGYTKPQIQRLVAIAREHAGRWHDMGILPPTSGDGAVYCSKWVDFMPHYELGLKHNMLREVHGEAKTHDHAVSQTLKGLKIVLNAGSGSGGFFRRVLEDLGADVSASIHTTPDSNFPNGYIPNPESDIMIDETMKICKENSADIGIMLDTDADRCGFVVPRTVRADGTCADYEPLGRNRLIALLGVMFSKQSPGCAIVTDSVTSNGLATFLKENLGLVHVRYLKGYANVINKAKELTQNGMVNAEVAIETSGHCAMKENDYLDDGTYTAVKVVGLLAVEKAKHPTLSLLDLIKDMMELDEVSELRMPMMDGSLETTQRMFDFVALEIEHQCENNINWTIDQENLEGIRVSTGADGGFFMLRKSLHDPIISLQIEASSKESARAIVVEPLLQMLQIDPDIHSVLHLSALKEY